MKGYRSSAGYLSQTTDVQLTVDRKPDCEQKSLVVKRAGERGAGLAEYGLLSTLVALVCIVAVTALAPVIVSMITDFTTGFGG